MAIIKKKLFLDFDGVIINTIKAIVDLYNEDFHFYEHYKLVHWSEINTWKFTELECASKEYINTYFNQQRLFDRLEFMENAEEVINDLKDKYEITVVSMGDYPNLRAKEVWIEDHLPFVKFIGCDFAESNDKSHIDMSGGILIDDSLGNLVTSNADFKICFGDVYPWNEDNDDYYRCYNWYEVADVLL